MDWGRGSVALFNTSDTWVHYCQSYGLGIVRLYEAIKAYLQNTISRIGERRDIAGQVSSRWMCQKAPDANCLSQAVVDVVQVHQIALTEWSRHHLAPDEIQFVISRAARESTCRFNFWRHYIAHSRVAVGTLTTRHFLGHRFTKLRGRGTTIVHARHVTQRTDIEIGMMRVGEGTWGVVVRRPLLRGGVWRRPFGL